MSNGRLRGTVELYDVDVTTAVQVGGQRVPLESDPSAALAYRLEGSPVWDFEIAGFREGDFSFLGNRDGGDSGLYMLHRYLPGLIPVVFVHGTASSPARWAEMVNEPLGDRAIASRYQIWLFIYNSGNPIVLSAMRLRESLQAVRKDVDPQGTDPALNQLVLIGHSQGGLLTKMMIVNSGNRFWSNVIALTRNCTTTIREHALKAGTGGRLDWRLLANGHADQLLYERRQIDTDLPIASLRAQSNITERAKAADHSPDFCRRIRLGLPDFNEPSVLLDCHLNSVAKKASCFGFRPEQVFLNHLKPQLFRQLIQWNRPTGV